MDRIEAHLDDRGKALREEFEQAEEQAKKAWTDFREAREFAETKGLDLSTRMCSRRLRRERAPLNGRGSSGPASFSTVGLLD
jgi:hypothetical protein